MGRVITNAVSLASAREQTPGVLPGSPSWKLAEPNSIGRWGATITKVARTPISRARQRRKGVVTDMTSGVEFEADATLSGIKDFVEGFAFAKAIGPDSYVPSAATTSGFTVPSLSSGQAGRFTYGASAAKTLVYSRGFSNAANNGLHVISSAPTTGGTNIPVTGGVAETPAATRDVEVAIAGVRGAAGDLEIDADGNLVSTALDFTTLGLSVGQAVHVGGISVTNQFFETANIGFARIKAIAAHKITFDKRPNAFVQDDGTVDNNGGAGAAIDILFGQFIRNVDVGSADYQEVTTQFELAMPNLGSGGATNYEYAKGNYHNAMSINLPLNDKATMTYGFVGLDTTKPTASRATNAASAKEPGQTAAFSTVSDIARLRMQDVDEAGLSTDFKSVTFTLTNNAEPEKVLGKLAAGFVNFGNLEVDIEATLLFTNPDLVERIRCNRTVSMDFGLRNSDGGVIFDIPSGTLDGGDRSLPTNQSVTIATTLQAHKDATLGYSFSASFFPVLPPQDCQ